ncbi:tetratricopeptide repeat protein, partial [Longimicrobium sp.]|uniref:tetratricopeptide repeat protein n=1 Tax=Longimicrobium sp. TaxID=2029185 RepID=UPI002F95EF2F
LVLWQGIRHVRAWLQTPVPRRAELFHPHPRLAAESRLRDARAAAPELRAALDGLLSITRSPLTAAGREVAAACAEIARWAERNGHAQTAILFAEAAAVLDGSDAAFANHAGRLTRNAGEFARADLWFQRAIGLARGADASVEYTRAQLGYGRLWHTLGDVERARKHYNRGSVAAMRQGLEWLAAEAQHDIFTLLTESHLFGDAGLHAWRALTWYPKHHPRLPLFVADVGYLLICTRHYSAASLLRQVTSVTNDGQRAVTAALYLRARTSSGRTGFFRQGRRRLISVLSERPECLGPGLIHLAEAARAGGDWLLASEDATAACKLARSRHDAILEEAARAVLQKVGARMGVEPEIDPDAHAFRELITAATARLSRWDPSRQRESRSALRREWVA